MKSTAINISSFFFLLIIFFQTHQTNAQCPGACIPLLYEGFEYGSGEALNGQVGGTGFAAAWNVQNGDDVVPGYQIDANSQSFLDLQTFGNNGSGGRVYLTAGRMLNVGNSGPFSSYLNNNLIAQPNTTLYVSALLRKNSSNDNGVWLALHNNNIAWFVGGNRVAVGYFGANSNTASVRYWTLRVGDDYYQTTVPVTIGTDALLVLEINFGASDQHTIDFWVNPASIGATMPSPTLSQAVNLPLGFNAIAYYGGSSVADSQIDEIRFSDSYQCAVPDAATAVNQLPIASFTNSGTSGQVPFTLNFNGSASTDLDGSLSSYFWQFGDGGTSGSVSPSYTFENAGVLQVVLTVTDNCGTQSSKYITVMAADDSGTTPCLSSVRLTNLADQGVANGSIEFNSNYGDNASLTSSGGANFLPTNNTFTNLPVGDYILNITGNNGCSETFNLTMPLDNQSISGWTPDVCDMQMGINVDGAPYWNKVRPFKDIKKTSGEFFTGNVGFGGPWNTGVMNEIPTDAEGYPMDLPYTTSSGETLVRCVISADGSMRLGTYVLLYDGNGVISMQGDVTTTSTQAGRIEFSVVGEGNIWFHINESTAGSHLHNIRIVRTEHEANYLTEPFYEAFLEKINVFTTIRFMDWGNTNGSLVTNWNDRTQTDCHTQGAGNGIAYEYMIDLANRLQKDIWVCVPHLATDSYITQMATLFENNLNSNLNIYIEYSNEVWNWQFSQAHWVFNNGSAHLVHPRQYAERSRKVFETWHSVFAGQTGRVKRVLATQAVNPWLGEQAMAQIKDGFDYLSPTWYFGYSGTSCEQSLGALGAGATGQDVLDCSIARWRDAAPSMRQHYHNARLYGKEVIEYEGGQHLTSNPVTVSFQQAVYDAQINPNMTLLYDEVLDSLRIWGSRLAVAFTLASVRESVYGSWGALEYIEQDPLLEAAPKWDVLNANIYCYTPPVMITVLPVSLTEFVTEEEGCDAAIFWRTEAEFNASHFEIQRSLDEKNFESIHILDAMGNGAERTDYEYFDKNLPRGIYFYRLKQVDLDGTFEFSPVKTVNVNCGDDHDFALFPNPTTKFLEIAMNTFVKAGKIQVLDAFGKIIQEHNFQKNTDFDILKIDLNELPDGVYFIQIVGENWKSEGQRFVKM